MKYGSVGKSVEYWKLNVEGGKRLRLLCDCERKDRRFSDDFLPSVGERQAIGGGRVMAEAEVLKILRSVGSLRP